MTRKYDFLVFIGRLQPLTLAHERIIKTALDLSDRVVVVMGSNNSPRTLRNPFTVEERARMIRTAFGADSDRVIVVAQDDYTYQDEKWLVNLQINVKNAILNNIQGNSKNCTLHGFNSVKIGLIGHKKDETSYYLNMFPGWQGESVRHVDGIDATLVRTQFFKIGLGGVDPRLVSPPVLGLMKDFTATVEYATLVEEQTFVDRYQQQWANSPYPPTFVTVDAVVVQSGHVLMVRRGAMPGKGMWALPGGFLNPKETLEQGMIRELREETRLKVPEPVLRGSIVSREVFDNPHRSSRGRTITTAFLVHLKGQRDLPKVKGSDDAAHAQWVPISDLDPRETFEDHYHIIQVMLGRLGIN